VCVWVMSEGPALVDFGLDGNLNIFRGKESQTKFIGLIRSVWTHWAHLVLCWGHWFVQEENVGKTSKPQSKHYILNEGQTEQEPRVLLSGGGEHDREHRQEGG